MSDRPDSGAAIEQEPPSVAPAAVPSDDDEFWRLAKKGLVAWGHEPSAEEIVGYWRDLVDEQRQEAEALALATADTTVDGAIALLARLVGLGRPATELGRDRGAAPGAEGASPFAVLAATAEPNSPVADSSVVGDPSAAGVPEAGEPADAGRGHAAEPSDPAGAGPGEAGGDGKRATAAGGDGVRPVVTAEAVGWLAVPVTGVPPPLKATGSRTWWRVAAARPGPVGGAAPVQRAPVEPAPERPPALGLGGGGLAFADCLATLDRRRRAQQAHRRWGRHIALPVAPLDAYERELRHGADAAAAELLETTLRAAVAGAGDDGLPPVRWVEAATDEVVVALAAAEPAPSGFVGDGRGSGTWTTSGDRDELEAAAARALPPLPLLAPLGRTATGRERLVDLEARGVVTVDGGTDDVLGLLRATVVSMATAAWCTPLRIVAVGLERDLAGLPGVEAVDSLDVALTYAEAHVHEVASALAAVGERSLGRVRARGLSSAAAGALLVVSARPPDDSAVGRRVAALAERRSSGVGVLLRHPPRPEVDLDGACSQLRIDEDGSLQHDGQQVWARRLDAADARRLVGLLTVAGRHDDAEAALRPRRISRTGSGEGPADDPTAGIDVLIRVLGDVEVVRLHAGHGDDAAAGDSGGAAGDAMAGAGGVGAGEVLAYLALREASVTHATLEAALFPDGAPGAHAVDRSVTAAVELVGPGLVRRPAPGRFAVSDRVATDYGLLCDLVARADDALAADDLATAAERLTTALGLVRSVPLGGSGRCFAWAGPAREAIVARVVDAADSLACLRARADDWAAVDRAAAQGLRAAPACERLHRWRMRAAHTAGDVDRVHELFEAVCDLVADPAVGVEPEATVQPETVQLLEALVTRRPASEPIAPAETGPPAEPGEVRRLAPDRPLPVTEELPEVAATRPPDALIA